jgi:hypothetical protein
VHRTFAGTLERGEENVSFHALALIARSFGMPIGEMLAGLETGESPKPNRQLKTNRGGIDRGRVLSEVAALEINLRALKEIVSSGDSRPRQGRRKPR